MRVIHPESAAARRGPLTVGTTWTAERLRRLADATCGGQRLIVLSNREPIRHVRAAGGDPMVLRSGGGVVTALEPLLEACHGVWVAHGAGTADRDVVEWRDGLEVPPDRPSYRLRRVWLTAEEERRYYYGFANEALWPLCHRAGVLPAFRADDFATYARVNEKFSAAVGQEAEGDAPVVLVQDYHFALAPRMIRDRMPLSTIIAFWHIPWPAPREFESCPWSRHLVAGLLGSDIIGFQTDVDCRQFLDTVASTGDARVDRRRGSVFSAGHETIVREYPVSIEWPSRLAERSPDVHVCRASIEQRLGVSRGARIVAGVDRLEYTKGLCEKMLAVERVFERHPELRDTMTFVQIAEPSRECLPAYRELRLRLRATADRINRRFASREHQPIVLVETHSEPCEVFELLRAADVCYVGSLHDGMNLVAKEFVAARDDHRGALVLSTFAGAARQLTGALLVNPFDVEESAQVLVRALRLSPEEQATRMRAMRGSVAEFNSYRWAGQMLQDAARLRAEPRLFPTFGRVAPREVPA